MHTASPQQALGFSRAHTIRRTAIVGLRALSCGPKRLNVVLLIRITKRLVRWVAAVSAPIGPIRVSFNRPRLPPSSVLSVLARTETKVPNGNARTVNGNGTEPATTSQLGSATRRGGGAGRGRPHLALPFAGTCARPSRAPPGPTSVRAAAPRSGHLTVTVLSTDRTGLTSRHSASSRRAVPSRRSTARRCRPLSGPARRGLGARPPHRRSTATNPDTRAVIDRTRADYTKKD